MSKRTPDQTRDQTPDQIRVGGGLEARKRNDLSTAATTEPMTQPRWPMCLVWTLSLFVIFWVSFFVLYLRFPYIKNGADVVFDAKLRWEASGPIFPSDPRALRLLIFGNSKILAGFVPSSFDQLAAAASVRQRAGLRHSWRGHDHALDRCRQCGCMVAHLGGGPAGSRRRRGRPRLD